MLKLELKLILEKHGKWLRSEEGGKRANLRDADLRCADLQSANLRDADLRCADLQYANLQDADLRCADLQYANLQYANLRNADLQSVNLRCANLHGANLQDADLQYANLQYANLRNADLQSVNLRNADLQDANLRNADLRNAKNIPNLYYTSIVPECGSFIGWKKVQGYIIKLEILEDAKRCNATGRKCRCSAAKVLEIQNKDGSKTNIDSIINTNFSPNIIYKVGEVVLPDSFDDDRWNECSHGIHFFITRQEAVEY